MFATINCVADEFNQPTYVLLLFYSDDRRAAGSTVSDERSDTYIHWCVCAATYINESKKSKNNSNQKKQRRTTDAPRAKKRHAIRGREVLE